MTRAAVLATLLWVVAGARWGWDRLLPPGRPAPLRVPLEQLELGAPDDPLPVRDLPLADDVVERTGTDSHLNRMYTVDGAQVQLYVGYVEGYRESAIHHPLVCLQSVGWKLRDHQVVTLSGPNVPPRARFNEYVWAHEDPGRPPLYTLTTFCHDGVFEPSELKLRALGWGSSYFAVISLYIAGPFPTDAARERGFQLLAEALPKLLEHFPASDDPAP